MLVNVMLVHFNEINIKWHYDDENGVYVFEHNNTNIENDAEFNNTLSQVLSNWFYVHGFNNYILEFTGDKND